MKNEVSNECTSIVNDNNIDFILNGNIKTERLRHNYPTYLFSFGGSGNTLSRVLIEYTTNTFTGSIYNDESLIELGMKGEQTCHFDDVYVIKAHPEHLIQDIYKDKETYLKHCLSFQSEQNSTIIYPNISAIFIIRDPWKSMFSEYQLLFGDEQDTNWHFRHKMLNNWNGTQFAKWINEINIELLKTFELMNKFDIFHYEYIIVKYENLINLTHPNVAMNEMKKIIKYLYNDNYYNKIESIITKRVKCIFTNLMQNDYARFGKIHRKSSDPTKHLTFSTAFQYVIDNHLELICNLQKKIKTISSSYSYTDLPGLHCQ